MVQVEPYHYIAGTLGCIALVCSLITLWIIRKMKFNGFLLLLTSLSVSQVVFDIGFIFLFSANDSDSLHGIYLYVDMFGEIMVAIWTNLLSLLTFRIVYTLRTVNIYKEFPIYLLIDISFPIMLMIYSANHYGLSVDSLEIPFRIFYWIRMFSVVFNIICYGVTAYLSSYLITKVSSGKLNTTQAGAITTLVGRMKYYSVVQIVLITGACWHGFNNKTLHSDPAWYAYFCTAPMCGIGYFLVFLYMQPMALKIFCKMVAGWFPCLSRYLLKEDEDDGAGSSGDRAVYHDNRGSEAPIRPSMIPTLTDEQLAYAIDQRYSARGVELHEAPARPSSERLFTGSILPRPISINMTRYSYNSNQQTDPQQQVQGEKKRPFSMNSLNPFASRPLSRAVTQPVVRDEADGSAAADTVNELHKQNNKDVEMGHGSSGSNNSNSGADTGAGNSSNIDNNNDVAESNSSSDSDGD